MSMICNFCKTNFKQLPSAHLAGQGCPTCGGTRKFTKEQFIEKSKQIHFPLIFDYSNVVYDGLHKKVHLICPNNHSLYQEANAHIRGSGCPRCAVGNMSKIEERWLNFIQLKEIYKHKSIRIDGKLFYVDGYDPHTNTIYEFFGDYWHGNPEIFDPQDYNKHSKIKFEILFNNTLSRIDYFIKNGYKIVSIWENEFKKLEKENNADLSI